MVESWKKKKLDFRKKKLRRKTREREKEKDLLRENLERGWIKLWILDSLKRSRATLHSKELNINPSPVRAKLGV